jgi:C4-dicarboxylate-specific signal transduction histidine kinase
MSVNAFDIALRKVCDSLAAPCAVFDPATDALLLANPAFRQEFGALPASRAAFEQQFEPVTVTAPTSPQLSPLEDIPQAQRVEVFCPRSSRWYSFQWSVLRNHQDNPLTLLNAQNLTERMETLRQQRALQEQLLSSSRAMSVGEMTTTLAHEINQPLATIVNCLAAARTLLGQAAGSPQPLRQALDLALEQAEQAGAVVARIREFVRTREPRREALGLKPLIDHVVQLQQVDAQKHRARILVELAPELPPVLVDRIMIEQVLTNLIRNGIEAMRTTRPTQRSLNISAHCEAESRVVVRVADRGSGVPACDEGQLFTPFFTTKQEGMGIGLAICRSIVEFHGGQLYFERNTGGGSVFAFTLPQAQES